MPRKVFAKLTLTLALVLGLSSCLQQDFQNYPLYAQARGLSDTETVIVSNGSNLEITGTSDLSWTEPRKFKRSYRSDDTVYSIHVVHQPSSSNKICRVLNPEGSVSPGVSMIRIECGYPVVIADTGSTMTTDNGLMVSNYLEDYALNASRTLTTSLNNEVYQDPNSSDPNDKVLRVSPVTKIGAITFKKLYMEGEPVTLSFSSVNQGCEITGANNNSGLTYTYPTSGSFMNTVQTIPLDQDWITNGTDNSNGRSCGDFVRSEYFLSYDETENPGLLSSYSAECFPTAPVDITCGFALKAKVKGLDTNAGEFIELTATRNPTTGPTHILDLTQSFTSSKPNRGIKTFNLAFKINDTYTIDIESASNLNGKICLFSSTGTNQGSGTFNNTNIVDAITCN